MGVVIFKRETVEEALRRSQLKAGQYSTQRNFTSKQCSKCFLSFETFKMYPHQICPLCRWELVKEKGITFEKHIKHKVEGVSDSEENYYSYCVAKGIELQRRKERTMRAKGVTFHRVLSDRLKPLLDLLDQDLFPNNQICEFV